MLEPSALPVLDNEKIKLTPYQLIFYYEWLQNPQRNDYNIVIDNNISGDIDFDRFNACFLKVANEHFILSHNIANTSDGIYWKPRKPAKSIVVYHPQKLSDIDIYKIIAVPFDLENDLYMRIHLIKLSDKKYRMIFIFPHIVVDGVSTEEIWEKLRKNYNGSSYEIPSLEEQIKLHERLTTQFEELLSQHQDTIHPFWQKHLKNVGGIDLSFLEKKQIETDSARRVIDECLFSFGESTYTQVKKLKYQYRITPYLLGQMVLAILFHKLTNKSEIALAYPIAFTEAKEVMYGSHINTMLIDYRFDKNTTLQALINYALEFFKDLKKTKAKYLPVNKIVQYAESPNVLDVAFAQTFFRDHACGLEGMRDDSINHDFHIDLVSKLLFEQEEHNNRINYRVRFDQAVLAKEAVQQFVCLYERLFDEVLSLLSTDQAHTSIKDLSLLDDKQTDIVIKQWNATYQDTFIKHNIIGYIEKLAASFPERTAVVYKEKKISYGELNNKANLLAHYLKENFQLKADDIVALCLDRSEQMLLAMLAVLKAGAAYVPISPTAPDERIAFILQDAQAKLVLADEIYQQRLTTLVEESTVAIVAIKPSLLTELAKQYSTDNLLLTIKPSQLAYVIYTSGTTGTPKGVMIEHQGLMNLAKMQGELFELTPAEKVQHCLWYSDYVFDAHVSEIYTAIVNGHTLFILEEEKRLDFQALRHYIQTHQINIATIPPVLLDKELLLELDRLVVAGDVTHPKIMENYRRHGVTLINAYGPSEASVCSHLHKYEIGDSYANIGRPLHNVSCYILNDYLEPLPVGVTGMLYLGGLGIARGYLNNQQLTEQSFIVNPFQTEQEKAQGYNGRLYKTGDLARYTANGDLEYIGRNDSQVKIRGFRIELEEIESRLLAHPAIEKVTVLVKQKAETDTKYLVAYYVAKEALDKTELAAYLAESLPDYMVPNVFVYMSQFPLLLSGKIDRKALPEPQLTNTNNYVAPTTEIEIKLCELFANVLGLDVSQLGIEDDFFQLGGDSITGIQLVSRIRQQLGVNLGVNDIFNGRTIKALASQLSLGQSNSVTATETEQGLLTGELPLLPIQQWFFNKVQQGVFANPNEWNQCFVLQLPKLDKTILQTSLQKLVAYHDAFRLYYLPATEHSYGIKQLYSDQPASLNIEFANQDELTQTELDNKLASLQASFDISKPSLYQLLCITNSEQQCIKLYFILHHLIVDAVSWRIISDDLQVLYQALSQQKEITTEQVLGDKGTSYRQWATAIAQYKADDATSLTLEKNYWASVNNKIPAANSTLDSLATSDMVEQKLIVDSELTKHLTQRIHAVYNTQINDVLLAALVMALQKLTKQAEHAITLEGHGREVIADNLDINRTVGWFTAVYPVLLESLPTDVATTLINVKEYLRTVPHHGIGYGPLVGFQDKPLPTISFNYLGQFESAAEGDSWGFINDAHTGLHSALDNKETNVLAINGAIVAGQFHLVLQGYLSPQILQTLMEDYKQQLIAIVNYLLKAERSYLTVSDTDYKVSQTLLNGLQLEREVAGVYLANSLQQGFIYHAISQGDEDEAYRSQLLWDYHTPLDEAKLKLAWQLAQQKYPSLRLRFSWDEALVQIVDKQGNLDWRFIDISALTKEEQQQAFDALLVQDRHEAYDLSKGNLFRLYLLKCSDNFYRCIFNNHHAILDGWSNPVLLSFVHNTYLALLAGQTPTLIEDTCYLKAQAYLQEHKATNQAYWHDYLQVAADKEQENLSALFKVEQRHIILSDYKEVKDPQQAVVTLANEQYTAMKAFCALQGVTVNALLQYSWHKLLSLYSSSDITLVGMTVAGRSLPLSGIEESVGLYINTLPIVLEHTKEDVTSLIKQLQAAINEGNNRSNVDLVTLQQAGQRLFNSLFVYENYPMPEDVKQGDKLAIQFNKAIEKQDYPLVLTVHEDNQQVTIKMQYAGELFDETAINELMARFPLLLQQLIAEPTLQANGFNYLQESEYQRFILQRNNNRKSIDKQQTIHRLFAEQVALYPQRVAVKYQQNSLTYKELDSKANCLALYLKEYYQLQANDLVALCLNRSEYQLIAILAVLKAGAAYVPMDPLAASERLSYMVKDTATKIVLTDLANVDHLRQLLPAKVAIAAIDETSFVEQLSEHYADKVLVDDSKAHDLAYIIYTSGTTGQPKGVMVEHCNVVNLFSCSDELYGFNCNDVWTLFHSYTFDFSVWEMWGALLYGGKLVVPDYETIKDTDVFYDLCLEEEVTVLNQTPSAFYQFIAVAEDKAQRLTALRYVVFGGEALNFSQLKPWYALYSEDAPYLINMYGITETTVHVTYKKLMASDLGSASLIGDALPNYTSYILDTSLTPVPVGVTGELYIGGNGVTRGYLNNLALTAERFINNPFQTDQEKQQGFNNRLYKTGDLGRLMADGSIEYIGRADFQVKIRGFRIELGEIEAKLSAYQGIKKSVVLVNEQADNKLLVAYYVAEQAIADESLISYLQQYLPAYMIPTAFIAMEEFPLTVNGKLDRQKMPSPVFTHAYNYVPPTVGLEVSLCNIFADVLGLDATTIGIEDDFFKLGGDSISCIQLINRVRQQLQAKLSVKDVFASRTVKALASKIVTHEQVTLVTEQGLLTDKVNLLPIQQWFFEQVDKGLYKCPNYWNQSVVINTPSLDTELLQAAIRLLVNYHDALRMIFKATDNGYEQYYQGAVATIKFSVAKAEDYTTATALQDLYSQWQNHFDITKGELYHIGYVADTTKDCGKLHIALHHLIVDAVSLRIIKDHLQALYQYLVEHPAQVDGLSAEQILGNKGTSYRQWVEALDLYAAGAKEQANYWQKIVAESAPSIAQLSAMSTGNTAVVHMQLAEQQTKELLRDVHATYHTQINEVLLTALALALDECLALSDYAVVLEGHGREEIADNLDINRTVGWFTSFYPVLLKVTSQDNQALLVTIKDQLNKIPLHGIGYGPLVGYCEVALPKIAFNYLGNFTQSGVLEDWSFSRETAGLAVAVDNNNDWLLNINGMVVDNILSFSIAGQLPAEQLQALASAYQKQLENLAQALLASTRSYLTQADIEDVISSELLNKLQKDKELEAIYRANSLQQGFVYHALSQGATDEAYRTQMVWEYHSELNSNLLKQAWLLAQAKYPSLRLRFCWDEDIVQVIDKQSNLTWTHLDLTMLDEAKQQQKIADLLVQDKAKGYDLGQSGLFRITLIKQSTNHFTCLFNNHHAILDGWSNPLLLLFVHDSYLKLLAGQQLEITPEKSYLKAQAYLQQHDQKDHQFWDGYLAQVEDSEDLAALLKPELRQLVLADYKHIKDPQEQDLIIKGKDYQALKALCQQQGVTLNALLQYVWHKALSLYGNSQTTVLGMTVAGRNLPIDGIEESVGLYINTLPVILNHSEQAVVAKLVELQNTINEVNNRSHVALVKLQKGGQRLFNSLFIFENYPTPDDREENQLRLSFTAIQEKMDYPLAVTAYEAEQQLVFKLRYAAELFAGETIDELLAGIESLLKQLVTNPYIKENGFNYLSPALYNKVVVEWNNTISAYPQHKTIAEIFAEQVAKDPDTIAIKWQGQQLTYRQLDEQTNLLAHHLKASYQLKADDMVALCLDRSPYIVISLLAILKAGGAYVPMDIHAPDDRFAYILTQTKAKAVITNAIYAHRFASFLDSSVAIEVVDGEGYWERLTSLYPTTALAVEVTPSDLAYVLFTSGTTGNPKGVMIEQRAYVNLIYHYKNNHFAKVDKVNTFSITNYVFDIWGLEYGLPLLTGGFVELATSDFTKIETAPYHFIQMTPSVWSACLDKITFNNPELQLLVGGEPVTPQLLERFFKASQIAAVLNVYGPTETTIWSTTQVNRVSQYDSSIGRPISNTSIYVLNSYKKPVPVGVLGELYIGGAGVARGYLNNPELTASSFVANPYQSATDKQQAYNDRLYKTGDLVRYLPDGRLEFIGRNDFQVKIRGFRIELGEIESRIAAYPSVKQTIVVAKEHSSGNKYLVAYYVADQTIVDEDIRSYLSQYLTDYMIPAVFIGLTEFPLTPSGKVNRKALPEADFIADTKHYSAPVTPLQTKLCELFAEVLGVEACNLGIEDNFFSLGGDSILVIKLVNKINKAQLGQLQLADIFNYPTVSALANQLSTQTAQAVVDVSIEQTSHDVEQYLLSFAQERLWFIEQYEKGSNAYNIPMVFKLKEQVNLKSLQLALQTVVSRHQILRSVIKETAQGESYQEVLDYPLIIKEQQLANKDELTHELVSAINYIFDLAVEYPIQAKLYQLADSYYMSIVVHHIAFDGWSTDIFINEVLSHYYYFEAIAVGAYKAATQYRLPPLSLQYKDYALWQRKHLTGEYLNKQTSYWLDQLADFETLNLPTDKARPLQVSYQGADVVFTLEPRLSAELHALAKGLGVTLYSVLLSAYYVLLAVYSNQKDIVVGTPIANRNYSNISELIGFFVNTLALRQQVDKTLSIKDFINKVSRAISEAQLYQELPFERLVEVLKVDKDSSRHPIFQVTFGMESFGKEQLAEVTRLFEPYQEVMPNIAKFDLSLVMKDTDGLLSGTFNYATALFDEVTIDSFIQTYQELLVQFTNTKLLDAPIKQLSYVSKEQFTKIIHDWNANHHTYPNDKTLNQLFEKKAAKVAERIAVVCEDRVLTYSELNAKANKLAHYLTEHYEITADTIIGLYLDRSENMVVCMLAVLKTGGAYAPIDPTAPKERALHIITETNSQIILTNSHYKASLTEMLAPATSALVAIDDPELQEVLSRYSSDNLNLAISSRQLAYVIYTSGTTGVPKGVMIEHSSAINFIMAASYQLDMSYDCVEQKKCLWISNYVFDAHIYDVYATLLRGNSLYILVGEQRTDLLKIKSFVEEQQIDLGYIPPVLLDKENLVPLKKLIVAGEVANAEVVESYVDYGVKVFNLYGPTEISVGSHFHLFGPNDKNTNIGKPISNDTAYLTDEYLRLVPIGAIGELYIGGAGVSRGYLNNPDLTAERFLTNPFQTEQEKQQGINQRIYKTGDLAKYLANGDIEYIGRNDFQVKIRGLRIELGEIEARLAAYPAIQKVAVLTRQYPSGESYIVAYYVADSEIAKAVLIEYLSQYLPDYMLPSSYVSMAEFPYTMNGKLDRRKLPEPTLSNELQLVLPANNLEERLQELFATVLKLEANQISVEDSFFELGGNSILVVKLAHLINKTFNKELPVATIFTHKTIRKLALYWQSSNEVDRVKIVPVAVDSAEQQLLSFAQQRLWFIESLQGGSTAYNVPILLKLKEDVVVDVFINALLSVIHRHEVLRSVIKKDTEAVAYQSVIDDVKHPLVVDRLTIINQEGLQQQLTSAINHIFKLDNEYPIKVTLYQLAQEYYVSIVVHHIAFDGWSADILVKEIYQFYQYHLALQTAQIDKADDYLPAPLAIQYKDYALWQRDYLASDATKQQLTFWKNKLVDYRPLVLPLDKPRPAQTDNKGENLTFSLTKQVSDDLRRVAKQLNVSLYSLLLSGYYLLLMTYSSQDDVVVGTPVANRNHPEVEGLVGFFVNSLALRQQINKEQALISFIKEVGEAVTEAQLYQDLPFDLLVNELQLEQDLSKNPIFQVMFSLQSFGATQNTDIDKLVTIYNVENYLGQSVAKFDLTTMIDDSKESIEGVFNYAVSIFTEQTIAAYITTYILILEQLAQLVDSKYQQLKIIELSYTKVDALAANEVIEEEIDWSQFEV